MIKAWESEEVFVRGDDYFSRLIKDVNKAQKSICIETYIFCHDRLGKSLGQALNRAAERGVEIFLLVDGVGTSLSTIRFLTNVLNPKIHFRVYHPPPWAFFSHLLTRIPSLRSILQVLFGLNRRNHRKTCIIDSHIGWTGSLNVCDDHLVAYSGTKAWRDTGVRVVGGDVVELSRAFQSAWDRATFNSKVSRLSERKSFSKLVRLNDTWQKRRKGYHNLISQLDMAREKIWITNAYFIPHGRILKALCRSAKRGVDVRVLVPRECDIFFVPWVRSVFYGIMLESGIRIFEYLPSMLHAKTMIIDHWVVVGSSNLNHRSLHHDLEADVVLTSREVRKKMEKQFLEDLHSSLEITLPEYQHRSWIQTGSGRALLLLKNWM